MKNKGELNIIVAAILFGAIGIVYKYLTIPPVVQNFYRFLFSATFLILIVYVRKEAIVFKKESFINLLLISLGIIGASVSFSTAVRIIPVGTVAFIFYLFPIIIVILSGIFLNERVTKNIIIALILATAGVFLLSVGDLAGGKAVTGYLLSLLAATCYSIVIIFSKKLREVYSPTYLAFLQALIVCILLLPITLLTKYTLDFNSLVLLVFLGVIISGIGVILLNTGLGQVTANRSAVLMYIEPVATLILAIIFFKQVPGLYSLVGCGLILLANYYIIIKGNHA